MKKNILFLALFCSFAAFANPIVITPDFMIDEFYKKDSANWAIDLWIYDYYAYSIDKIYITVDKTSVTYIPHLPKDVNEFILTISNDSILSKMSITDTSNINVSVAFKKQSIRKSQNLYLGFWELNSAVSIKKLGYSGFDWDFALSNKPGIGRKELDGTGSFIKGKLLDSRKKVISNVQFISSLFIKASADDAGNVTVKLYPFKQQKELTYIVIKDKSYEIEPINVDLAIGDTVFQDIRLRSLVDSLSLNEINELYVPDRLLWKVDLLFGLGSDSCCIDSVQIKSKNGMGTYRFKESKLQKGLITLTNDSLDTKIAIDPVSDSIQVIMNGRYKRSLSFGYKNSDIPSLTTNTSIKINHISTNVLSYKPNIGVEEKDGIRFILLGKVLDNKGNVLKQNFCIDGRCLNVDENGNYVGIIDYKGKKDSISKIRLYWNDKVVSIKPFTIPEMVTDTIYQDIIILEEISDIKEQSSKSCFLLYPNPASNEIQLSYNVPFKGKLSFQIYSITGQFIETILLEENKNQIAIAIDKRFATGVYIGQLIVDGKIIQKEQFVVHH